MQRFLSHQQGQFVSRSRSIPPRMDRDTLLERVIEVEHLEQQLDAQRPFGPLDDAHIAITGHRYG